MSVKRIERLLLATALVAFGGCDLVAQLPVITSFPPSFDAATQPKILPAAITQNNGPLNPSLRVRCEFWFAGPPQQLPTVRSVDAQRLAGNAYNCTLPSGLAIPNNHVLLFEWLVESIDQQGQANPVARSGVKQFQVGCAAPAEFLRNDQAAVVNQFGGVLTTNQIIGFGYVPTHPAVTFVDVTAGGGVPTPFTGNKVFTGMGVAFARAQDVLAAGNFAPSGLPQSGQPNLLLFLPSLTVPGRPDLAPLNATYSLNGWAYAVNQTTAPGNSPPNVGCFPLHEWFFHEAGVHTLDGGFSIGVASAPGVPHDRLWDLHLWRRASGVPEFGIVNVTGAGGATTPSAGFVAPANSFFHPDIPLP